MNGASSAHWYRKCTSCSVFSRFVVRSSESLFPHTSLIIGHQTHHTVFAVLSLAPPLYAVLSLSPALYAVLSLAPARYAVVLRLSAQICVLSHVRVLPDTELCSLAFLMHCHSIQHSHVCAAVSPYGVWVASRHCSAYSCSLMFAFIKSLVSPRTVEKNSA